MSILAHQRRTLLRLLAQLRPHWRRAAALPARIQSLFAAHREFGSRDRRLYRELIYTTLRYLPWIEPLLDSSALTHACAQPEEAVRRIAWLAAENPATAAFRAAFANGDPPAGEAAELLLAWFRRHCPELFTSPELETQLRRAPLWLRLQTDEPGETRVFEEFSAHGWSWQRSAVLPDAVELHSEVDVTKTATWREGLFEVQDLGSQLILASVGVAPGGHWLDACAGAGGKTLQLARLLGPSGKTDAHDIRPAALAELERRSRRARKTPRALRSPLAPIGLLESAPTTTQLYDGVLVDALCSGSGTWRRAPHLKWVTTENQIARAAETQRALLAKFAAHVRPGGQLVYATCSLSSRENETVVADFLTQHPEFQSTSFAHTFAAARRGAALLIFPSLHNTDGFFVASLRRSRP